MPNTTGASEHVAYEIEMLSATNHLLVAVREQEEGPPVAKYLPEAGPLHDAVLESFALHVRNLIEFFFDPKRRSDDTRAEHFFADPLRWKQLVGGAVPDGLKRAQGQAHKQISHITYARVAADRRWDVSGLTEKLEEIVRLFLDHADEQLMGPELLRVKAMSAPQRVRNALVAETSVDERKGRIDA